MQKRYQQAMNDIINYLLEITDGTPVWRQAYTDALSDLMSYVVHIDDAQRDEYFALVNDHALRFRQAASPSEVHFSLSNLSATTQTLKSVLVVDFIILRQSHWGAVEPLAHAFRATTDCCVRIVPTPMIQERQDAWGSALRALVKKDGYETLDFEKYDIECEMPDIVVDDMAVDCAKIPEFRFLRIANLIENTVHLEHSILTGYTEAMKHAYFRIGRSRCWQYITSSALFASAFPLVFRIDGEYITCGYPEMDMINKIAACSWSNHASKTVLWNVDTLDPNKESKTDYFRIEKEIDYLDLMTTRYPEIVAIVRPHPDFYNQPRCQVFIQRIIDIVSQKENVKIDKEPLIYHSYKKADAMVTWMSSTTSFTFGATGKPFVVLPTFMEDGYDTLMDMNLLSTLYVAFNASDIESFYKMILTGKDPKAECRKETLLKYTGPVDGTASFDIVKEVLTRYERRYK